MLSVSEITKLRQLYLRGVPLRIIAAKTKHSRNTIRKFARDEVKPIFRKLEVAPARKKQKGRLTPKEVATLKQMYAEGLTVIEIARKTRRTHNTVRRFVIHGAESDYITRVLRLKKPTKLEPYQAYVEEQVKAAFPAKVCIKTLHEALKEQGYTGSSTPVYYYSSSLFAELKREREQSPEGQLQRIMKFLDDLGIFFNPDEFGTKATLKSKALVGYFEHRPDVVEGVQTAKYSFTCIDRELPRIKCRDIIRIQRKKYHIVFVKPQTDGLVTLALEKAD